MVDVVECNTISHLTVVDLQTLEFQVEAVAGEVGAFRTSTATVKLEIIDTNDNSPQFTEEVLTPQPMIDSLVQNLLIEFFFLFT